MRLSEGAGLGYFGHDLVAKGLINAYLFVAMEDKQSKTPSLQDGRSPPSTRPLMFSNALEYAQNKCLWKIVPHLSLSMSRAPIKDLYDEAKSLLELLTQLITDEIVHQI